MQYFRSAYSYIYNSLPSFSASETKSKSEATSVASSPSQPEHEARVVKKRAKKMVINDGFFAAQPKSDLDGFIVIHPATKNKQELSEPTQQNSSLIDTPVSDKEPSRQEKHQVLAQALYANPFIESAKLPHQRLYSKPFSFLPAPTVKPAKKDSEDLYRTHGFFKRPAASVPRGNELAHQQSLSRKFKR